MQGRLSTSAPSRVASPTRASAIEGRAVGVLASVRGCGDPPRSDAAGPRDPAPRSVAPRSPGVPRAARRHRVDTRLATGSAPRSSHDADLTRQARSSSPGSPRRPVRVGWPQRTRRVCGTGPCLQGLPALCVSRSGSNTPWPSDVIRRSERCELDHCGHEHPARPAERVCQGKGPSSRCIRLA